MDWFKARDAHFLGLQTAVFCVACELISENNTPHCLACGSQAVISLSRVLGGSLRRQQTAHLIADAELDRLVHESDSYRSRHRVAGHGQSSAGIIRFAGTRAKSCQALTAASAGTGRRATSLPVDISCGRGSRARH